MENRYPHVFSPVRVAGHLLKNRLISAPSTIHTASSGQPYPTDKGIRFFVDRAKAGVGLVTCAGVSLGGAFDDGTHCSWNLNKGNDTNTLCNLVEEIHMYGAKCTIVEGRATMLDMVINMGTKAQAQRVADYFKENADEIYAAIIDACVPDDGKIDNRKSAEQKKELKRMWKKRKL